MNKSVSLLLLISMLVSCSRQEQLSKPNIIVILADDMGYSDLGCMGSEIETPNLDALAGKGVLFTDCYNTSRCCPTRASLLTGLYQHQAGYGDMDSDLGYPSYQGRFREGVVTIAQLLKQTDYHTIMIGKWHLGHQQENIPLNRGFDKMYGIPKGGGVYFYPCVGRDRQVYLNNEQVIPDSTWYSTDAFTDYAIHFAEEAVNDDKPFFLYLAYIAPHFPLQAKPEDIQKYRNKYSRGYEYYRTKRFQKQKDLGIIAKDTKLSPADYTPWKQINNKDEEDLKMAVYAAQIDCLDQNIGKLLKKLKELNVFENTIILFLSDNGAISTNLNTYPEAQIGTRNSWAAYGKNWGNVSNTPFRYYKTMTHEGGIKTPLIVHWPEGIKSKDTISHEPIHLTDIYPTILELAQSDYPKEFEGEVLIPLAGESFLPLMRGNKQDPYKVMFWEHEGNQAVRIGGWKLVRKNKKAWELYNLQEDPTELNNLIDSKAELADSLKSVFNSWAKKCGVKEWPVKRK